jgi:dipeptidyl aminopeptidase/acylaminoacyl peptidase
MIRKIALLLTIALMPVFAFGVYNYLGTKKTRTVRAAAVKPIETKPRFFLPGTMIVIQAGGLYKLEGGKFTQLGRVANWSQVAVTPDHSRLVTVSGNGLSTDLSLLESSGSLVKQLTQNSARVLDANHWAFYPRISPDGKTLYYSYDRPKFGYQVDMAVWSMPLNGTQSQARRMTTPNDHTGGDVMPIPLASGGLMYVKYSLGTSGIASQIWLQTRPLTFGKALTNLADDCNQPALSRDGKQLAMVCTSGKQSARLVVASFDGKTLGPMRTLVTSGLNAAPAWAPDGSGLAYLAPTGAGGHFQLWWLALPAPAVATPGASGSALATAIAAAAPKPQAVTSDVDLTPTTALVWY